ncbi:hypothetical protein F5Y14DRAFT_147660 [Nemania sp. NC0429]|nr:hypothetical protein F5Y14DRAFT_147660 [Nemania sp. NC0429]
MADVYTPPPDTSYRFYHPFYAPTDTGSIWAVAVPSKDGTLITAALSVVLLVIFMSLWKIVCFVALLYPGSKLRSRYVALVALWNSNDSWFAFWELMKYAIHFRSEKGNLAYGLAFALCAFVVFGGSLALGIVVPSLVQIGNVAPVRPSAVHYPAFPPANDIPGQLKTFGLRASSFLRALGSVEAAGVTKRDRVSIDEVLSPLPGNDTEQMSEITYNYSITGAELGLQHGAGLALAVNGFCRTEYDWIVPSTDDKLDVYSPWGSDSISPQVPLDDYSIRDAPKASFILHPDAVKQYFDSGNTTFAIVVWSAHRASISTSSNPWYATEDGHPGYQPPFGAKFWVKRSRPALSCWQHDKWTYGAQTVKSVYDLDKLPGIRIQKVLLKALETALSIPVLVTLGNASGDSALRSRTTSPNGVIDASASTVKADLERLLVASFVATRNVFVDATMFKWGDNAGPDVFTSANGQPAPGAGDFVVTSPDIQTFSLAGIIVLLVVLAVLLLIDSGINLLIHMHRNSGKEGSDNTWVRSRVLLTAQLFRRLYEDEPPTKDDLVSCDLHFLEVKDSTDEFKLNQCAKDRNWCNGHIARQNKVEQNSAGENKTQKPTDVTTESAIVKPSSQSAEKVGKT